jgi:hypothetical protein
MPWEQCWALPPGTIRLSDLLGMVFLFPLPLHRPLFDCESTAVFLPFPWANSFLRLWPMSPPPTLARLKFLSAVTSLGAISPPNLILHLSGPRVVSSWSSLAKSQSPETFDLFVYLWIGLPLSSQEFLWLLLLRETKSQPHCLVT